jgi:ribosomal protein S12 methylthiotransferase accessory factor
MTSLLPHSLRRTLQETHSTLCWKDPTSLVWYETTNYGASHLQRSGFPPDEYIPVTPDFQGLDIGGRMRLSISLFISPRLWWQQLVAYSEMIIIPVFFHRGRLVLGPAFEESGPTCPTCASLRLGQGFPHPQVLKALLYGPITCAPDVSLEPIWSLLGQESLTHFALTHCDRLREGEMASLDISGERASVSWHRILPPPGNHPHHEVEEEVAHLFGIPECAWSSTPLTSSALHRSPFVDILVGPLLSTTEVLLEIHEPQGLTSSVTVTGLLGKFTRWHPDVSGSGLAFDAEQARWASIGEAVERYSGNYIPRHRLLYASEDELVHLGREFVPLSRLRTFTREQEAATDWPFAQPKRETSIPWIPAQILGLPSSSVLLPAEFVCLNLNRVTKQQSQMPVPLAGIAAHRSQEAAIVAALLELIERDASMLWWHGKRGAKLLTDLPNTLLDQIGKGVPESIQQWFLLLPTDMPAYVVAGCLYDREKAILVVGFAARPTLADALRKSIAEAWQLRRLSLQLLDRKSVLWQAIDAGQLPMPVKPFRTDRSYRKAFRADFADMHQLAYNLQYYLDPETLSPVLARLSGEPYPYSEVSKAEGTTDDVVAQCLLRLEQEGERAYYTDLTTPDMDALGFVVVRVVCPYLVGNTPTAFIPLAHPRIQDVLSRQGGEPYLAPLPHA